MNIITIDIDIIMEPSINDYNEYVGDEWEVQNIVDNLPNIQGNMTIYRKLTMYIQDCFTKLNKDQILFIDDHSQILSIIDEPISLVNIDHHHDTGYDEDTDVIQKSYIDCGNWVRWLFEQKLLKNYTWIKNENSYIEDLNPIYINQQFNFNSINLSTLFIPDKLVLCLSTPWVPPRYRLLFYAWQDMYKKTYNTENVPMIEGPYIN